MSNLLFTSPRGGIKFGQRTQSIERKKLKPFEGMVLTGLCSGYFETDRWAYKIVVDKFRMGGKTYFIFLSSGMFVTLKKKQALKAMRSADQVFQRLVEGRPTGEILVDPMGFIVPPSSPTNE